MQDKIRTLAEMREIVDRLRKEGRSTVFVNGCFDLLHVGHIRYLRAADDLGDVLIVGLNGDESVRALKGPGRPLLNQQDRAEILSALRWVDHVIVFDDLTADRVLLDLRPDFHAKGTDYTETTGPERETVLGYGGRVAIVGDPKSHSTRQVLKQISEEVD
jgi:rfaE bifunctional protein nucleotidyltransferase chain/domain